MRRIVALDFYRFVAAFGVVVLHLTEFGGYDRGSGFGYWTSDFSLLVDFFFILSGFVIAANYSNSIGTASEILIFLRKRLARIYPLYLATTLFFLGIFAIGKSSHPENYATSSIVAQLFLVQQWQINPPLPFNFPAWSISAEWAMYLLFPLLVWISHGKGRSILILIAMSAGIVIFVLVHIGTMHQPIWNALRALPTFTMGVLLYEIFPGERIQRGAVLGLLAFSFSIASLLLHLNFLVTIAMFCLTIFLTARDPHPSPLFRCAVLKVLGDASYSVYLLHAVVFSIVYKGIAPRLFLGQPPLYVGLVTCALIIPISVVSFYCFEAPARKFLSGSSEWIKSVGSTKTLSADEMS